MRAWETIHFDIHLFQWLVGCAYAVIQIKLKSKRNEQTNSLLSTIGGNRMAIAGRYGRGFSPVQSSAVFAFLELPTFWNIFVEKSI